jgi:hypothetical protein
VDSFKILITRSRHFEAFSNDYGCNDISNYNQKVELRGETPATASSFFLERGDSSIKFKPHQVHRFTGQVLEVGCACLKALPDFRGITSLRKAGFSCESKTEGLGSSSQLSTLLELQLMN